VSIIKADHYREEESALARQEAVLEMAVDVALAVAHGRVKWSEFEHESGDPRFDFMQRCLDGYQSKAKGTGEEDVHHSIGGVSNVVLRLAHSFHSAWKDGDTTGEVQG
jgi:hypothetical protein